MSEFNLNSSDSNPRKELEAASNKYNESIKYLANHYPVQYLYSRYVDEEDRLPVYETDQFDMEEPDGTPIVVIYSYYPEGIYDLPTLRCSTIIEKKVEGLGSWIKNYHSHLGKDSTWAWEKREWFNADQAVLDALKAGQQTPSLTDEIQESKGRDAMLDGLNAADSKAYSALLAEEIMNIELEKPDKNELAMLQTYIDQLV